MNIIEKLKRKFLHEKARQTEEELYAKRDVEAKAKVMIEEFLIPKFKHISDTCTLEPILFVNFNFNISG